jgi:hypothetical protein
MDKVQKNYLTQDPIYFISCDPGILMQDTDTMGAFQDDSEIIEDFPLKSCGSWSNVKKTSQNVVSKETMVCN